MPIHAPILCMIDDDLLFHQITKIYIEKKKIFCEFYSFSSGLEALNFFESPLFITQLQQNKQSMLILLDLSMPSMNGWEFLDEFKQTPLAQLNCYRILIQTSSVHWHDRYRAEQESLVSGYLEKPWNIEEIEKQLKAITSI